MGVKRGRDNYDEILVKGINKLLSSRLYVGIPSENSARDDDSGVTNAQLGWINEKGSPLQNIPARPFLAPGVASVKNDIIAALKKIGSEALSTKENKEARVQQGLTALGLHVAGAVQEYMSDPGHFEPLAEATIEARKRKGMVAPFAPLKETGQMWRSIKPVIRPKTPANPLKKREDEGF